MTPEELRGAVRTLGFTAEGFARRCHVAGRTMRSWLDGTNAIPGPVVALIELLFEVPQAFEAFNAKGWDRKRPKDAA